ncbi:hypothetical protein GCM10009836_11590 [Pseudonocardia ailaonensis]|uniref:DUF3152 domain-containing protein n=1 Tax=Pseudonocardia ailaonensis TaxID=367279 RepID=A0ABN2MRV0_9PSEU
MRDGSGTGPGAALGRAVALLASISAVAALAVPVLLIGFAARSPGAALPPVAPAPAVAVPGVPQGEAGPLRPSEPTSGPGSVPAPTTPAPTTPAPTTPALPTVDLLAGLTARTVPMQGNGNLVVVPGGSAAPGTGPVRVLRVEVEDGLPVDAQAFAQFVMDTLNDPRGWGAGGRMSFARTDGEAPIHLVLATPDTADRLCAPLDTAGEVSCRNEQNVVLNFRRWVEATPEFAANPTGYRQYLVNHEVGHALGHGHELCPGPGQLAPVMQQQTLGLDGCTGNSWPYP